MVIKKTNKNLCEVFEDVVMEQNDQSIYIHTNIKSIYRLQRLNISIDSHMCSYF